MKTALYPGTFDPLTNGHVSLVRRGRGIFDRIILGIAADTPKTPLFSIEERVALAKEVFKDDKNILVEAYCGLTVEFANQEKVTAILRGLRAVSDFEYEFQLALMNRRLEKDIQTVFLMTDYKWLYISSTMIKGTVAAGGDIRGLVPENVREALLAKLPKNPRACTIRA